MSIHNNFTQFSKGLLNGFGFGVGAGLVNMANRLIFGSGCSFPPLFGFGFGPCCMGNPFTPYFTPMPNFTLPSYNNSIFSNFSTLPTLPTLPDLPTLPEIQTFSQTPVNTFNMGFQFPIINIPDLKLVDIFEHSAEKKNHKEETADIKDYNKTNGSKLAQIARERATGFKEQCAKYVSDALEAAGLSNGKRGHGYQMAEILRKNDHFKEINVNDIDWKNLPEGCILTYDKGAQGYSEEYGHVEITTGDGKAVSDGVTNNIRKPSAIFIPV